MSLCFLGIFLLEMNKILIIYVTGAHIIVTVMLYPIK
jgi:hypothetical protein